MTPQPKNTEIFHCDIWQERARSDNEELRGICLVKHFRLLLIGFGLSLGLGLNIVVAPQIMSPRPPVFNGPDIAESWPWRSMAIQMHSWWLWEKFPNARVTNVGFVPPLGRPDGLQVGMKFSEWWDQQLGLEVDLSEPPLDFSQSNIREQLFAYHQVYSRIHCRIGQEMVVRDACYYFVAWDPENIDESRPVFVGVELNRELDNEEMALIELGLLTRISPKPLSEILTIDELTIR